MAKSSKKTNIFLVILIVVSIILFSSAFILGYYYKEKIFSLIGPRIQVSDPQLTKTGGGEEDNLSLSEIPDDFPGDFPIYINSTVKDSWTASGNVTKGISIIWESSDSMSMVHDYYKENLTKNGWDIKAEYKKEDSEIITFEKDKTSGFVGITNGDSGKTIISVTMGVGD